MREVTLDATFESFREAARGLLAENVLPADISWRTPFSEMTDMLPGFSFSSSSAPPPRAEPVRVSPEFISQAKYVYAFRADDTPGLIYRILWRLQNREPNLLRISIDDDIRDFESRYRLVKRDVHKMKAFVRFREVDDRFIAWHNPDHHIVRLAAPFFEERFNGMNWSILTNEECVHWDQTGLTFSEGLPKHMAPQNDDMETLWKTYYSSIFNPARIKWNAMTKEMPIRHWKTMPETAVINDLIRNSPERLNRFYREQNPSAGKWLPDEKLGPVTMERLKDAIPECQACGICERATGPVMGEGPLDAELVIIGEQPGDEEDKHGRPFIGPAGKLLDQALREAGMDRERIYLTNAVKAFKWQDKEGYGRLHRGSSPTEIAACNPWLKRELDIIKPKKILCLGRSAAQAMLGKSVLMRDVRGQFFETSYAKQTLVIPHPSFMLRQQDPAAKAAEYAQFVSELSKLTA